jgi:hypothetical protein
LQAPVFVCASHFFVRSRNTPSGTIQMQLVKFVEVAKPGFAITDKEKKYIKSINLKSNTNGAQIRSEDFL